MFARTEMASLPLLIFFFFRQVMVRFFSFFSDRYIGHVSRTKKQNKKGAGFPFVGWHMINTVVSKNHIQIHHIERGIAKQRLGQHLGWPTSYVGQNKPLEACST